MISFCFISFVFVLICVFICHEIFPECSGWTLGSSSHVPKIILQN